jgi:crotonobetainyl-CoA:carnitine CoA-transferase CaiB-like acyl-CoA transferase
MQLWCQGRTTEEALASLEAARIPCGPIYAPAQTIDDPHVKAAGFFESMDYPGLAQPAPLTTTPVRLSATPGSIAKRAPTLGEHTDEVLQDLGYSAEEIAALREQGAI